MKMRFWFNGYLKLVGTLDEYRDLIIDWNVTDTENHMVINQVAIGNQANTAEAPKVLLIWRMYLLI